MCAYGCRILWYIHVENVSILITLINLGMKTFVHNMYFCYHSKMKTYVNSRVSYLIMYKPESSVSVVIYHFVLWENKEIMVYILCYNVTGLIKII